MAAEKEHQEKDRESDRRCLHMKPEQIIAGMLRGEKCRAGPVTKRKVNSIAEAFYRAGARIMKRPVADLTDAAGRDGAVRGRDSNRAPVSISDC
jgi:hypothetical protein